MSVGQKPKQVGFDPQITLPGFLSQKNCQTPLFNFWFRLGFKVVLIFGRPSRVITDLLHMHSRKINRLCSLSINTYTVIFFFPFLDLSLWHKILVHQNTLGLFNSQLAKITSLCSLSIHT